jgi:hypothetical protein
MTTLLVATLALLSAVIGAAAVGPVRNETVAPWNSI